LLCDIIINREIDMNLYDFDKTIYKYESSSKYYFFVLRRHPWLFWHLFCVAFWGALSLVKIVKLETFKEHFFSINKHVKDVDDEIKLFWDKQQKNIFSFYYQNLKPNDVICSASPEFLVKEIMSRINPKAVVICSDIDKYTGKFKQGKYNCKAWKKVHYLEEQGFDAFDDGYSDNIVDRPMLCMCKHAYKVKDGKVSVFEGVWTSQ